MLALVTADLATALVQAAIDAGVRDVVACAGSRNTPLLMAFLDAEKQGRVRLHMRIDERGAAFLALGLAKATDVPGLVVTTSGTAVGNLLPAMMEAHHSGVGLVAVSADRPASMRGTGASQTTIQPGLMGVFGELIEMRTAADAARAMEMASQRRPIHLNVEIDDCRPGPSTTHEFTACRGSVHAEGTQRHTVEIDAAPGTVLVLGDAAPADGRRWAREALVAGIPVLAEPSSNGRIPGAVSTYRLLLAGALGREITHVVVAGRPTLSRPQRALLTGHIPVTQISLADADRYPATTVRAHDLSWVGASPAWAARWQQADAALRDRFAPESADLTGATLVAEVLEAVGTDEALFWGASQLIRDADLAPITDRTPQVYATRGLAGIDGSLSVAMGLALARPERPVTAVVGDLTALHDLNALVIPALEARPRLRIVVGNDDGGAIFSTLEQGALAAETFDRLFGVAHGRSLADLARAAGVEATQVTSRRDLRAALARPIAGLEVVEVRLDRAQRRATSLALNALVDPE